MDKSLIQALTAGGISAFFCLVVYRLARVGRLSFRYAVGWLTLFFLGVFSGVLVLLISPIANFLGITPTAVILLGATVLFVALSIQLSVSISGIQQQNRLLAEVFAQNHIHRALVHSEADSQSLSKENVLVVVPAFNEESNIAQVLSELNQQDFQVLVIDDGSRDATARVAQAYGVQVLVLPFNMGVGGALRAGFKYAVENSFQAVIQVDADGQHSSNLIELLISEANSTNAHLVIGSRFKSEATSMRIGLVRRIAMRWLARSASRATGIQITDATSGFRLIRNPLLKEFSLSFPSNYLGDTYEALLSAGRANYVVREIPTVMKERNNGVSSASQIQAFSFTIKALLVATLRIHSKIKKHSQI